MTFGYNATAVKVYNVAKDYGIGNGVANSKGETPAYTNNDSIGLVLSSTGRDQIGLDFDGDGASDFNVDLRQYSDEALKQMGFTDEEVALINGLEDGIYKADETGKTNGTDKTGETEGTKGTNNDTSLEGLKKQRQQNLDEMDAIEGKIEELSKSAAKKITDAIDRQQKLTDEHKEAVENAVTNAIKNYTDQVKRAQNGGDAPESKNVGAAVQKAIAGIPGLGDDAVILSNMAVAQAEIDTVESLVGNLKNLISETQTLEGQIKDAEAAAEAARKASESQSKSCDPIGFQYEGSQFDFVVMDADGFNTTSDFLGADGTNFGAMEALDGGVNGEKDGKVDLEELNKAGIGLLDKTTGKVMTADEMKEKFGEDFSINLDFDKNGAYDGINAGDDDGDGVANQTLLGTYSLNIGGQKVTGYDTDDDQDWLAKEYGITANVGTNATAAQAATATNGTFSQELQAHMDKLKGDGKSKDATFRSITDDEAGSKTVQSIGYENVASVLRAGLEEARESIGMSEDFLKELDALMKDGADAEAERIHYEFITEYEKQQKAEEDKAAADKKADVTTDEEGFYVSATTGKYVDADGNEVDENNRVRATVVNETMAA